MRIKIMSVDEIFEKSSQKILYDPTPLNRKKMEFSEGGIYSPQIFGNLDCQYETFSCECGEFVGPFYKDVICPKCNSAVQETTANVDKTGWILLNTKIISPIWYNFIIKILPNLDELIAYTLTIDSLGNLVYPEKCIGMTRFIETFETLIDESPNRYKHLDTYNFIKENLDKVFVDKIEIFNVILRPAQVQGTNVTFDRINNVINFVLKKSIIMKTTDNKDGLTYEIQKHVLALYEHILELLKGKDGIIRGELLGTRLNFTSRCVIIPASPSRPLNEVVLPYLTVLELYRYHIIRELVVIKNINHIEAYNLVDEARVKHNPEIIHIMKLIENREVPCGFINRNPTISLGSILFVNFKFKYKMNDLTMELSNLILKLLSGDFDGDGTAK